MIECNLEFNTPRHPEYNDRGQMFGMSVAGASTTTLRITAIGDATDDASVRAVTEKNQPFRIVGQCDKHEECKADIMVGIGCWLDNVKGGKWT